MLIIYGYVYIKFSDLVKIFKEFSDNVIELDE